MLRWDITGLLWDDYEAPKEKAVKIKREPPDPVWLKDDYLPNLEVARAYKFDMMSDSELMLAHANKEMLIWDTEFYTNYTLIGFQSKVTGKLLMFEMRRGEMLDLSKLRWVLQNFLLVGFNDTTFDVPMAMAACAGFPPEKLMVCVNDIIYGGNMFSGMRPNEFYKAHKLKPFFVNHIDLIELTPLSPSLKVCAGRMHAPYMMDLPYEPGKVLSEDQITILRWYWTNDLRNTEMLYDQHRVAIDLREHLGSQYSAGDIRSKSDPQVAEAVIRKQITMMTGRRHVQRAEIIPGRTFRFQPPAYLQFSTPNLRWLLDFIRQQDFVIDQQGGPLMPPDLTKMAVPIGNMLYKVGIGGLHSQEKRAIHVAGDEYEITDNDVTSYYPALILQQGMYPPQTGPVFLQVFRRIVDQRVKAKRDGDKATAETLKIVVNGTFGKTGERGGYSVVYYPEMMIQVTMSGQLSLLLLIERLEQKGIFIISANTDGIMIKCPKALTGLRDQIIKQWERDTGLEMETVNYKAVYSRDVNNYIALYAESKKGSSAFRHAKAVGAYRQTLEVYPLKWNPTCEIVNEAMIEYLATGKPMEDTINECQDVRKFLEVRMVRGGACKNGEYLGKAIRWYYAKGEEAEIINAKNGHTVPRSKGARPCMVLPQSVPEDVDLERYITAAYEGLADFSPPVNKEPASS